MPSSGPVRQQRPLAVRATVLAVAVALVLSALGSVAFTLLLHDTLTGGLITFATFGGLAGLSAGVLAWELASRRACPRCGQEQPTASAAACQRCGYDLRARPRYACTEGHAVAYEPGLCECGRRLLLLAPPPVGRHAARAAWLAVALFFGMLAAAALAALLR